jgi:hypothetical protein
VAGAELRVLRRCGAPGCGDLGSRRLEGEVSESHLPRIEAAARALRDKLKAIHDDPAFKSVWVVNQLHTGPYNGPTYTAELAELDKALDDCEAIPS